MLLKDIFCIVYHISLHLFNHATLLEGYSFYYTYTQCAIFIHIDRYGKIYNGNACLYFRKLKLEI